jgi:putative ABC transport system substrate-binding protein
MAVFRQRLREIGYVDGDNIELEERYVEGDLQRLNEAAHELVRGKVDLVVASALSASLAARRATDTIPIVMVHAGDPVGTGLVASLARPGGNVTGSANLFLGGKVIESMHELLPGATRFAVLCNSSHPAYTLYLASAVEAARQFGIALVVATVTRADEFAQAFATIRNARPHGLLLATDPLVGAHRSDVIELAAGMRLPLCSDNAADPRAGGLLSVGPLFSEHYVMAAAYVDKILKGARPAELPVEQPTRFEVVVNLKTAKSLGIVVPQSMLVRATEVVQ